MVFWTYILRCADGSYYTGHTDNLDHRISQHQTGSHCDFTSRRLPVTLVWNENFATRIEALEAERRIKPWSRKKKEALIRGDWAELSYWAKPPKERPPSPFVPSEVEGHMESDTLGPSTSLGTNGNIGDKGPTAP